MRGLFWVVALIGVGVAAFLLMRSNYVEIDATGASGSPIATNAVLKTRPIVKLTTEQLVQDLSKMLENLQTKCGCGTTKQAVLPPPQESPFLNKARRFRPQSKPLQHYFS
jgi:hypothetical protein